MDDGRWTMDDGRWTRILSQLLSDEHSTNSIHNSSSQSFNKPKNRMRPSSITLIGIVFQLLKTSKSYTYSYSTAGARFGKNSVLSFVNSPQYRSSCILFSSSNNIDSNNADADADSDSTVASLLANNENVKGIPPTDQIAGVIFDMDGTLIHPCIDFANMRSRIYAIADTDSNFQHKPEEERRGDVLELFHFLSDEGKTQATEVFDDIEARAMRDMTLMDSVGDLCHYLDKRGIKRAVLTRNVEKSVNFMQNKLWEEHSAKEFFPCVNRETKASEDDFDPLPSKPFPDAILHICKVWECSPENVIMVGDSAADDIAAANRAGCGGRVLLKFNGESFDNDAGGGDAVTEEDKMEREPSLTVSRLSELLSILQQS